MSSRRVGWVLVLAGLALAAMGCDKTKYEVTGEGKATVHYRDGKMVTIRNVDLPWRKELMLVAEPKLEAEGDGMLGRLASSASTFHGARPLRSRASPPRPSRFPSP